MCPRIGAFLGLSVILACASVSAGAVQGPAVRAERDSGIKLANLQDQLTFGLRARLPSEHAFIAMVVRRVEAGDLPLDLVVGTFHWARRKRPYPFPYFEHALRLRAARQGIPLSD
jgi:hypothetical protein